MITYVANTRLDEVENAVIKIAKNRQISLREERKLALAIRRLRSFINTPRGKV